MRERERERTDRDSTTHRAAERAPERRTQSGRETLTVWGGEGPCYHRVLKISVLRTGEEPGPATLEVIAMQEASVARSPRRAGGKASLPSLVSDLLDCISQSPSFPPHTQMFYFAEFLPWMIESPRRTASGPSDGLPGREHTGLFRRQIPGAFPLLPSVLSSAQGFP